MNYFVAQFSETIFNLNNSQKGKEKNTLFKREENWGDAPPPRQIRGASRESKHLLAIYIRFPKIYSKIRNNSEFSPPPGLENYVSQPFGKTA